jgi:hypothetical protein
MFVSRAGGRLSRELVAGALGRPAALLIAVALSIALGACSASTHTAAQSSSWSATLVPMPGTVAGITPAVPAGPVIEIEGDGIETQRAPRRRAMDETPDDPTEPFSPNYGDPNYGAVPAAEADPVPERA